MDRPCHRSATSPGVPSACSVLAIACLAAAATAAAAKQIEPLEPHRVETSDSPAPGPGKVDPPGDAESSPSHTNIFDLAAAPIDDELVTDRPDFTESTQTVPRGRGQLELGYTYTYDSGGGVRTQDHTWPEALLRLGLADGVELRLAWPGWSHTEEMYKERIDDRWTRVENRTDGCNDTNIGLKFHLREQQDLLPDMGIIVEMSLPSGAGDQSSGDVDPALKWLWSYDLTDRLAIAGNVNLAVPTSEQGRFFQTSASLSVATALTDRLGSYIEYFGFYPADRGNADSHYLNGGFTYLITNNLQADVRVGIGLNEEADDLFSGVGLSWRF